ncbi:MAG: SurA N-terminal domain-containing protein, partial [Betaproteobacteria bacterium]|nr:SurA N-terminal domain-containing protein [Betaproteobacteria bacterium]
IQGILFLIFLPFLFFGVDSYFRSGSGTDEFATVGRYRISQYEFNRALSDRQETIMRLTGGRAAQALLDSAELRMSVLDELIRQRLLLDRAVRSGMAVSDQQLQSVISGLPAFQQDGKFSFRLYDQYLKRQGKAPVVFETELRQDIMLQHMDDAFSGSVLVPRVVSERMVRLLEQQREVSVARIEPDKFTGQVKLADGAAKTYYDTHQEEFRIPEKVRVAYVTLSAESLLPQIEIDPEDVRKVYESRRSDFEVKEERQAAHILIAVDKTAGAETKTQARAKAQEIYEQVKKNPDRFAELAQQHSRDPGSAQKGGDLGYFSRGLMVKAFDDAVFKMKPGEIGPPVETEYGFHIIRLTAVRGAKGRSFEEVRGELEAELKKSRVGRKFGEVAENFNNIVFEQFETLKPAADLAKSPIRESAWIARESAQDALLNHLKLREAVFSEDVLKNKRNTEAIEVAPGILVAARVIEHKPSVIQPFEDVSAAITKKLTLQQASQLAVQEGNERLEQLRQGKDAKLTWGAPMLVSRGDAKGLPDAAAQRVFRMSVANLPAYGGVESPEGAFTLIRVSRVVEIDQLPPEKNKALADGLREIQGQEEMRAFVESLRQRADVKVSRAALEKKER